MQAFLASTLLVAVAEIGDKTQLLSFFLATQFPNAALAIVAGITAATLANHALAAAFGAAAASILPASMLRWLLALSFFAFALWALFPDRLEAPGAQRFGPFLTTLVLFFGAEMGDKTQLATVALAAQFDSLAIVVLATTLGMLLANIPAVLIGERLTRVLPLSWLRRAASASFAAFGIAVLLVK